MNPRDEFHEDLLYEIRRLLRKGKKPHFVVVLDDYGEPIGLPDYIPESVKKTALALRLCALGR